MWAASNHFYWQNGNYNYGSYHDWVNKERRGSEIIIFHSVSSVEEFGD
jgi:hypothetical protein